MKYIGNNGLGEARVSIAGNTWSRNRFGPYIRTRAIPINRRTSYQTAVRATFGVLAKNWGGLLSDANRLAWIAFAAANPFNNIFGESRILTGHMYFIKLNARNANLGIAEIDTPPASTLTGTAGKLVLTATFAAGGTLSLTTVEAGIPIGSLIAIYATPPLSPGINFVKSKLVYIGNHAIAGTPYNIKALWIAKFGAFPTAAGKKIFVAVQVVSPSGVGSVPSATAAIVA
jgi:hypothetical protein